MNTATWTRRAKLAWYLNNWRHDLKEWASRKVAWCLPKRIVYHAAIRLATYATVGQYSDQIVPDLRAMDAAQRWGRDHNLNRP